ncbi:MAG: CoA-binding protein [Alphaproteobacteria bacterium]|nr:CoA-binding protein [Alphaproteobacteria bacterium]
MAFANPSDAEIGALLNAARTIALVGASANPDRDSHEVMAFLQRKGHRVIPVNPGLAGKGLLGETVYAKLGDIPFPVDLADVFRASEYVDGIVDQCLAAKIPAIWTQLGVVDAKAAEKAVAGGMTVVMNKCPKIEYARQRLVGPRG